MEPVAAGAPTVLLADADVLIDYRDSDLEILALITQHFARLVVASPILDEVSGLAADRCGALGIEVIEPEMTVLREAALPEPNVSFNDRLCFVICRNKGWTCLTNDQALRRLCRRRGVAVRYGLVLMVDLVETGAISCERALSVAERIHKVNPLHINQSILSRFEAAVRR